VLQALASTRVRVRRVESRRVRHFGGDELGCSMDERLSPDVDGAAAPCATSVCVQEGAGDDDDARIGKSSSKTKESTVRSYSLYYYVNSNSLQRFK
jgi:hypothetical protein